jgi:hypothetical protein
VEQLLCKLAAALLFAIMLAMATNASLVQGLRFTSVIFLLTSSWHFGVAFIRRRPLSGPSEWGEAAIFSLIARVRLFICEAPRLELKQSCPTSSFFPTPRLSRQLTSDLSGETEIFLCKNEASGSVRGEASVKHQFVRNLITHTRLAAFRNFGARFIGRRTLNHHVEEQTLAPSCAKTCI